MTRTTPTAAATMSAFFSPEIAIEKPGYAYIYISNEEETQLEVFFDDFKVDPHKKPGGADG